MREKLLICGSLALLAFGITFVGCGKREAKQPKIDPHSAEGLVVQIMALNGVLQEGVKAKDYSYVDDRAYYLQGVVQALEGKLDPGKKQQLSGLCVEIRRVAEELDHAAGRKHDVATTSSMAKLDGLLQDLNKQYHQGIKQ
jgi:hypothetical protein